MGPSVTRRIIGISGLVQGVGFRPFVYNLALKYGLVGFVRNQVGGLYIDVQGPVAALEHFLDEVTAKPPPLARVDEIECRNFLPLHDREGFHIAASEESGENAPFVGADVATCDDCLAELFNP